MDTFLNWFNNEHFLDPVLKAAIAHLWFLIIHPFDYGNGRIGRAITDMLLARAEGSGERFYSMSGQIFAERKSITKYCKRSNIAQVTLQNGSIGFCIVSKMRSAPLKAPHRKYCVKLRFGEYTNTRPSTKGCA